MAETLQGRRIEYDGSGIPENGCYWRDSRNGEWSAMTPNGHCANLSAHSVTEHVDGTITVAPSILVRTTRSAKGSEPYAEARYDGQLWHGFLERGAWREC